MYESAGTVMDIFQEAKKRPVMSGVTLVGAAGAILLFMNVMPGLELIVRIKRAPDVADAALDEAKQAREWIEAYIDQQKQQQALEQQRYELEQEFNKQLLDIQRSQQQQLMPNQMQRPSPPSVWREQTSDGAWYCTDGVDAWWPDDRGECD